MKTYMDIVCKTGLNCCNDILSWLKITEILLIIVVKCKFPTCKWATWFTETLQCDMPDLIVNKYNFYEQKKTFHN